MNEKIDAKEMAKRLGRTPNAVGKQARLGTFGPYAAQDHRGRWLFDPVEAEREFRQNVDQTRYNWRLFEQDRAAKAPKPEPRDVVVYESERGRLEITPETYRRLERADANPDEPLLDFELAATLDRILFIAGVLPPDQKPLTAEGWAQLEAESQKQPAAPEESPL